MGPVELVAALIVIAIIVTPILLAVRVWQARRDRRDGTDRHGG